jgi:D-alanyl-D-alanine carboxypeptidase
VEKRILNCLHMKTKCLIIGCWLLVSGARAQSVADSMLAFFKSHPKTSSLYLIRNDSLLSAWNEKKIMPTAGMSSILIAFEYAKQAAYGVIDTSEMIPLKDIARYHLPGSKTDAYPQWLSYIIGTKKEKDNKVRLHEVAVGMMQFQSLANTEYLMDKLGFDNIKSNIVSLGLEGHSAILPPAGAQSLYQNRARTNPRKILKAINDMDEEEYCKAAFLMHLAMKNDSLFKQKYGTQDMNRDMLKVWSSRLPQASAQSYGLLLQTLLNEKVFDPRIFAQLRRVMEWPLQFPPVQKMFSRFSMTGSSTPFVFTQAQYGITSNKDRLVLVYICENLKPEEWNKLATWHQEFEKQLFVDPGYGIKAAAALKMPVPARK